MQRLDRIRSRDAGWKDELQLEDIEFTERDGKRQAEKGATDRKCEQTTNVLAWGRLKESELISGRKARGKE